MASVPTISMRPSSPEPSPHRPGLRTAVTSMLASMRGERSPARGVAVSLPRAQTPRPNGDGIFIVVNPNSGGGASRDAAEAVRQFLPDAVVHAIDAGDDLVEALAIGVADPQTCALGVIGGDGSVNVAAQVAIDHGIPLVVFPGGTLNHFARELGLAEVADTVDAVRAGQAVAVDVGLIDGHLFLNNASVGSYAELVDDRERMESRIGKWPAMVVALIKVLVRSHRLSVTVDGIDRRVWMAFYGNGAYLPAGFAPVDRPDLVDGLLDCRLIDGTPRGSRLRLIASLVAGRLDRSHVYDHRLLARSSVVVRSDQPVRLAADGETFDGSPAFTIEKRPAALVVYAPAPAADFPT